MSKPLVLALDGHDGAGKSSLANAFAAQMGGICTRPFAGEVGKRLLFAGERKHIQLLTNIGQEAISNAIEQQATAGPIVLDRAWLTVASFVEDKPQFFEQWKMWIPTTLCWADLPTTLERLNIRLTSEDSVYIGEQEESIEWHKHFLAVYQRLALRYNVPILRTDQYDLTCCLTKLAGWQQQLNTNA